MAEAHRDEKGRPNGAVNGKARPKRGKQLESQASPTPDRAPNVVDPDVLPAGCPPAEALDGPIRLYRLSATKKPAASDCRTAYEAETHLKADPCRRRSVSSYKDRLDADRVRARVRHFKDHQICEGTIPKGEGVHLATPTINETSHHSWWPRKGVERHRFFSVAP